MSTPIKTLCPYCGVGCGLEVVSSEASQPSAPASTYKVRGDRSHPSSQGMVCVKGATVMEAIDRDRLLYPLWRESLDQEFRRISWEEAFQKIVDRIQTIQQTQGKDAICVYGSGQFLTEDYYTAQKLVKGCLGTNNFDANSRLCMSSAVAGYLQSLGSDGPPCCYDDLELTDCAFIVGSNAAECHPIAFNRFRKHHKRNPNVKLIVVDPRCTETAEAADLHLPIRPGTDIDLFNGMAHLLKQWGYDQPEFIAQHTAGFAAFEEVMQHYSPQVTAERCGISVEQLEQAARMWGESNRVLSLWSMGMNQSSEGTAKVRSLINLHLLTGQIGKPGAGPFSLTGQPNAMGGREAGGLSHLLPGYRFVMSDRHRAEVEQVWKLPAGSISPHPGRTVWDMITGLETGEVGLVWIAATNPVVSLPDLERAKFALRRSPFTIYQEAYYPTETAAYAHLLLPACQWSEKTGTMTNSERRVTLCSAFRSAPGEAKPDWEIFTEVGRRLGFKEQFAFESAADVHAEFVRLTRNRVCDMTGISHDRLQTEGPLQWPLAEGQLVSTPRLYHDLRFPTPDGRARFGASYSRGLAEPPDENFPYVLTTGRLYGHWHTQTRTGRIEKIRQMHPAPFIEIHPRDAAQLEVNDGEWVEVRSRRGMARFPAKVTKAIAPRTLFVPMHWGELWADQAEANALTHPTACPDSKQPELKACAVQLIPIRQAESLHPLEAATDLLSATSPLTPSPLPSVH
ncbi:nitrate reductase [Leptolyngbya sp. FACHB-711]|uniref:molybdopterin oxidoreductase family protein n=1 Tax=unclassified Leptolyngbya TaxID=2650499 RepID=UPI0016893A4B|nr:nitrate reductase [Leptolyngbya sp. FACHB-711]MBD1851536.1 nitrate reductase [Cyanobacteria bacterium FACHB-502]MBD2025852.1 nitrate reductase [Leptolyngbya sp. FACHB-711]